MDVITLINTIASVGSEWPETRERSIYLLFMR